VDFQAFGIPISPISATNFNSNFTVFFSPMSQSSAKFGACLVLEAK